MTISAPQKEILSVLIELYGKKKEAIKGEDIAEMLHRTSGTIRNQMQTLKALGYVDGVPGPKGGYTPAIRSYEALGVEAVKNPILVRISRGNKPIEGIVVQKIIFTKVPHPTKCGAMITVLGDSRKIRDGEMITVGPTPVNHIIIKGVVIGRDDTKREIMIDAHSITSIPKGVVGDIGIKRLISLRSDMDIQRCAKLLTEKRINSAPVIDNGRLTGILTVGEIVRAVANGDTDVMVGDIMVKEVLTIDKEAKLIDSIKKMEKYDIGRLIVMDKEKPIGIITRTDILLRMMDHKP